MYAAILSKLTGEPETDSLDAHLDDGLPAAEVEATAYLDGRTIHHGTLAGRVTEDTDVPLVTDSGIHTEREPVSHKVTADFYADLEAGWAGVDASDGETLLGSYLTGQAGVMREDARLRLAAWAEAFERRDDAAAWGLSFSQSVEDGDPADRAGAYYHDEADANMIPQGVSALGFRYRWDGRLVRGMLAESGYVAVYNDWSPDQFARWVAEEVESYLEYDRDDQQTLQSEPDGGETEGAPSTCDDCGSAPTKTDLREDAGDMVCIVCLDHREEEREQTVADSAARADGGDDDA